jgi:hypothetical protein
MIITRPRRFLPRRLPRFSLLALLLLVTLLSLICAQISIERRSEWAAHSRLARQLELLNAQIEKNLVDYVNFSRTVGVRNADRFSFGASEEDALELQLRVEGLKDLQTVAIDLNRKLERMDSKFGSK